MKHFGLLILTIIYSSTFVMGQPTIRSVTKAGPGKNTYPPDWAYTSNIYEVNLRQYTPEGTINAFSKQLDRLHQMGVDILWFMPIQPIGKLKRKGSLGSYYSISDYMAINPEMGHMEDWIRMVDKAHSLGMKVILDWVANHTAFDHPWVKEHPEFYNKDEKGNIKSPVDDWSDVADLNYDNPELHKAMILNMKYWLNASKIDGFRCDMAHMVPTNFWQDARRQLEMTSPGLFMLGETDDISLYERAFDVTYGWKFHHLLADIAKGEKNADDIRKNLEETKSTYPPNGMVMYFTDNHDENSWQKTTYQRYGDALGVFNVLIYGIKGMPLVYSGQEAASNKTIRFFDKDTIDYSKTPLAEFYSKLNKLKKSELALMHGERGGDLINIPNGKDKEVFTFIRMKENSKVLFMLNLSAKSQKIKLNSPEIEGSASSIFGADTKPTVLKSSLSVTLEPWQYIVYQYKN
jgi:1,4-alpha-glucan branching enzyme